jgi:hypothetical protein
MSHDQGDHEKGSNPLLSSRESRFGGPGRCARVAVFLLMCRHKERLEAVAL